MKYLVIIPDRIKSNADIEKKVLNNSDVELFGAVESKQIPDSIWEKCNAVLAWHEIQYDRELLSKMKNCKVIVRVGVGYDNVDLKAAEDFGIMVCNVPDYGTDDVADHAMGLMLSLCRGLFIYNDSAKNGIWKWEPGNDLRRIKGSTLGIIGLGRIGTAVALRAKSFGLNVRFYDPYKPYGYEKAFSIERDESLFDLAKNSNIISVHTPLTNETKMMINKRFFASCNKNTIFINTARGQIVNLDDLYEAMIDDQVLFAGMDVLPVEPADQNHPLIKEWLTNNGIIKNRIIITPHSAFYNQDSYVEMRRKAAEEVKRVLNNQKPFYMVSNGK
jgi:lactate dehydrogenase-like 2-hydroxyacid dehydrogenase